MTLCDLCDLLFKNVFGFFSVTVVEERRKIICIEDRKDHKEETAGASQGFNPDHYTQFVGGRPAPVSIVWKSIARRCEQNTACATLRRRVVAVGLWRLRQDVLQRSLDTPKSNVV
jgi:hypothetical protein